MIRDNIVLKQLGERGGFEDPALLLKLEEKLNMPRYLDEPPKPIKLGGRNKEDLIGTAAEFRAYYNMYYDSSKTDEPATIDLSTVGTQHSKKTCSYAVFVVVKTLIFMGVTKSSERATACRDLFMKIISIPASFISKGLVYSMIESRDEDARGYYYETLCESIIDCMCTEEEKLRFHIIMELQSVKDKSAVVDKFLEVYKGLTPYEFDKQMKVRAKEITAREYHAKPRRSLTPAEIVAFEMLNGTQTSEKVIAEYVSDTKLQVALLAKYDKSTPKEMMTDIKSLYLESVGKPSSSPKKLLNYVGEMLCKK